MEIDLVINSTVYMNGDLVRSFLSIYADDEMFPELFEGNAFYAHIRSVTDLQKIMKRLCG